MRTHLGMPLLQSSPIGSPLNDRKKKKNFYQEPMEEGQKGCWADTLLQGEVISGKKENPATRPACFFHLLPMERASALPAVRRKVSQVGTGPLLHEGQAESLCLNKPALSLHFSIGLLNPLCFCMLTRELMLENKYLVSAKCLSSTGMFVLNFFEHSRYTACPGRQPC